MKKLTLKEVKKLYQIEKNRDACHVIASSGDGENEARNLYLAAVEYAGEELAVCSTEKKVVRAIYEAVCILQQ